MLWKHIFRSSSDPLIWTEHHLKSLAVFIVSWHPEYSPWTVHFFSWKQLKGRGDAEDLQERVLQVAASGQEGSSGEPRGALHRPAAAARSLRGNRLHLTPRESTSWKKKNQTNPLFIAHILNRHLLRQHSSRQGLKLISPSAPLESTFLPQHLYHKTWIVKFYENLIPQRCSWSSELGWRCFCVSTANSQQNKSTRNFTEFIVTKWWFGVLGQSVELHDGKRNTVLFNS